MNRRLFFTALLAPLVATALPKPPASHSLSIQYLREAERSGRAIVALQNKGAAEFARRMDQRGLELWRETHP